ncbi:hypothetical protein KCP70_19910 [Salmonella enterica subsp. enterica]|nr:hypothetical protein KCP70_19910 [Salmonella enterica subsp. enterica]
MPRLATGKPSRQFSGPQGVKQYCGGIASVRCRGRNTVVRSRLARSVLAFAMAAQSAK